MRMRRSAAGDESGAILAIVGLTLVFIFGMVTLVVDGGGVIVMRRRLVAAADSAALAAAQSCARGESDAESVANEFAASNVSGATQEQPATCSSPGAPTGSVTVGYVAQAELYFAPTVGFDDQQPVHGTATAIWGPAQKAEPSPIVLNLEGQHPSVLCATSCSFWLDPQDSDDPLTTAGLVRLRPWGASRCSGRSSSSLDEWITGASREEAVANPPPVSACAITEVSQGSWFGALKSQETLDKIFLVSGGYSGGSRGAFGILGFAPLRVESVLSGADEGAVGVQPGSDLCIETIASAGVGSTIDLNAAVLACVLANSAGLPVSISIEANGNCCSEPEDYEFDPVTNIITWKNPDVTGQLRIEISWTRQATEGACGSRALDEDAACVVLSWQGPQAGGAEPAADGSIQDFGFRAIRLSE